MSKLGDHTSEFDVIDHSHKGPAVWMKTTPGIIATIEKMKFSSAKGSLRGVMAGSLGAKWVLHAPKRARVYRLPVVLTEAPSDVEQRFSELADNWEAKTAFISALDVMVLHQDYQDIIGMGFQALPFIFRRLESSPARWFWALRAIVGHDVAADSATADEAVARWLDWATASGYNI